MNESHDGGLSIHHRHCPCYDCGLEREIDAALDGATAVQLTDEERAALELGPEGWK